VSAALTLAARAGYAFEHSPVPTEQLDTLLFDMDRHVVGAGAGIGWQKPFPAVSEVRVDLGLQLVLGVGRRFESSGSAGSSSHDASGNVWSAGADLGLVFGDGSG
jgi:long-subunit fatty acid transport protein